MSILTYRYRIKDSTSGKLLTKMASAVNYVWNFANEVSMLALRRDHTFLSAFDLINLTAGTSKDLGIHTDTISEVCREYATRRKQAKAFRLHWRSKKRSLGWIPFKGRSLTVKGDTVRYYGQQFRFWFSRPMTGTIKAGSFAQDAQGHWYVNFQCEVDDPGIPMGDAEIGLDLGLKDQVACSDGIKYSRDNLTRTHEDALAMAQRAHKKRRVAAIHAKIAHCRKDWAHKTSTTITQRAKLIAIGNVSSSKFAKTRMAKSIYDAGWSMLRTMLAYKAIRLGVEYCDVNESGSSVTCSVCFSRSGPRGLSALGVRVWCCSNCGVLHDRDTNAAHNILLRSGRATPSGISLL
jgi:IS605 OrfB family transposase